MKLFVDDVRKAPKGWHLVRTNTEAIRLIASGNVEEISLDHDIGCRLVSGHEHTSDETFEPIARYLALYLAVDSNPGIKVRFHTGNIEAGMRMAVIIGVPFDHAMKSSAQLYKGEPEYA